MIICVLQFGKHQWPPRSLQFWIQADPPGLLRRASPLSWSLSLFLLWLRKADSWSVSQNWRTNLRWDGRAGPGGLWRDHDLRGFSVCSLPYCMCKQHWALVHHPVHQVSKEMLFYWIWVIPQWSRLSKNIFNEKNGVVLLWLSSDIITPIKWACLLTLKITM